LLTALGLAPAGCTEEEKKTQSSDADAGLEQGPQKPVLGGKLAAAVKAAESAQGGPSGKGGGDGPPESGVFGPGLADRAQPAGAPARLEVLDDGKEPRVLLAPAPGDEQKETVSVTLRMQGSALPVDYALVLKVDKPKDEKKGEGPRTWRVAGKIQSVAPSPQLPRELSDKLAKLKGTEIRYTLGANGTLSDLGYALGKDAPTGIGEELLRGLVNAIGTSMPSLPDKPVGMGAYWMVTDRASTFGVDVVRYRVFKVEKIDKDRATLSIDVRAYATKDDADLGQKLTLQRFESTGKGKVEWTAAGLLPSRGETSQRTGINGTVSGGQPAMLMADVSSKFAEAGAGEKK